MSLPPPINPGLGPHISATNNESMESVSAEATPAPLTPSSSLTLNETRALHDGITFPSQRGTSSPAGHVGEAIEQATPVLSRCTSSLESLDQSIALMERSPVTPEEGIQTLQASVTVLTRASSDTQQALQGLDHLSSSLKVDTAPHSPSSSPATISVLDLARSVSTSPLETLSLPSFKGLDSPIAHASTATHAEHKAGAHEHEEESIGVEITENAETALKTLAVGLRAAEALEKAHEEMGAAHHTEDGHGKAEGTSHGPSGIAIACAVVAGAENILSVGLLAHEGRHLHKLRKEKQEVEKLLQAKIAAHESTHSPAESPSLKDQALSGLSKFFSKTKTEPPHAHKESQVIDPEIAKLQNRLDKLNKSIKEAGGRVAVSTASTSIGLAHMGIEVAKLAVGESMSLAAAGSGLVIGASVIGLALSTKSIYDNTKTLLQAKKELKATDDPALKEKLEEKITGAKVGISRGALSAVASSLGIAASGMGIAAAVGVTGLTTAIAATGFGALALAGVALLIGVSYLIYRNREAIAHFFSNALQGLANTLQGLAQGARVSYDQAKGTISSRLDEIDRQLKLQHEKQLISDAGRTTADAMKKACKISQEQEQALRNLKLMFSAPAT